MKRVPLTIAFLTSAAPFAPAAAWAAEVANAEQPVRLSYDLEELAGSPDVGHEQSFQLLAEVQQLPDDAQLKTVTLSYKLVEGDTAVLITPTYGSRDVTNGKAHAFGAGLAVYQKLSEDLSIHAEGFLSRRSPVFARADISGDVTANIMDKTTATIGLRWAQYFDHSDVVFLSGGIRRYFKRGSAAYRLTFIDPQGRDSIVAHLASLTINDEDGLGKTQFWVSAGQASIDIPNSEGNYGRGNYGGLFMRTQPIDDNLSLLFKGGINSYGRPSGRETGGTFALGLKYRTD